MDHTFHRCPTPWLYGKQVIISQLSQLKLSKRMKPLKHSISLLCIPVHYIWRKRTFPQSINNSSPPTTQGLNTFEYASNANKHTPVEYNIHITDTHIVSKI